jgi:hypothetical protein
VEQFADVTEPYDATVERLESRAEQLDRRAAGLSAW